VDQTRGNRFGFALALVASCGLCLSACRFAEPLSVPLGQQSAKPGEFVIGLCEDYPEESRSLANARRDLEVVKTNGLSVLRVAFGWDSIEPKKGQFDWSFWDEFVQMATGEFGIRLIPYICYTPKWAASVADEDSWRQPPRDPTDFGNFMQQIVTRYKGRINSWELWNEPDNPHYWLGSLEEFTALVSAGAAGVQKADPSAKIVLGGMAWNLQFLEGVITNRPLAGQIDIINLHNYYETWSTDPIERLPEYTGFARDILTAKDLRLPLWLAELGYSSYRRGNKISGQYSAYHDFEHSAEHQAESLLRMLVLARASGHVSLFAWYRINDLPPSQEVIGDVNNRHLGVLDAQGRPKPALASLRNFQSWVHSSAECIDNNFLITQSASRFIEAHGFRNRNGEVTVFLWRRTVVPGTRGQEPPGVSERVSMRVPGRFKAITVLNYEAREARLPWRAERREAQAHLELTIDSRTTAVVRLSPR
jgi:hypothetical protein